MGRGFYFEYFTPTIDNKMERVTYLYHQFICLWALSENITLLFPKKQ